MKFDKEYPATHSMETAWYAADEDGNVALISYNDNGPVPLDLPDARIGELAFGYEDDKDCIYIKLTEEQVEDLAAPVLPLDNEIVFDTYTYVKIDKENREFFETAMKKVHFYFRLVESEWGLYEVGDDFLVKYGFAKSLIKKKIISKVYQIPYFYVEEDSVDGKVVFNKNFLSNPYYVYAEPYWSGPLQRVHIPKHPVKLDQLPEKLRKRVPNLPIKFNDSKTFNIDDWVPCKIETSGIDSLRKKI